MPEVFFFCFRGTLGSLLGFDSSFLVSYGTCFVIFESSRVKNFNVSVLLNIQVSSLPAWIDISAKFMLLGVAKCSP